MNYFKLVVSASTASTLYFTIFLSVHKLQSLDGPVFLEIKCAAGHRKNLGRPTRKPIENKSDFMHFLVLIVTLVRHLKNGHEIRILMSLIN